MGATRPVRLRRVRVFCLLFAQTASVHVSSGRHCAVLTARVLKSSGVQLKHHSAWYSPATLYDELYIRHTCSSTRIQRDTLVSTTPDCCTHTISTLLHTRLNAETVRSLGDAKCFDAVLQLTHNVFVAARSSDAEASRRAQLNLANAVLKWTLLRTVSDQMTFSP
jgi:hypothetical protein